MKSERFGLVRTKRTARFWLGAYQVQIWRHPDQYHLLMAWNGDRRPFSLSLQVWR